MWLQNLLVFLHVFAPVSKDCLVKYSMHKGDDHVPIDRPHSSEFPVRGVAAPASGTMSLFTMLMTVPQVWIIWVGHQAAGVSLLSWALTCSPALALVLVWVAQRRQNIYLACLGWVGLDIAVIAGTLVYGRIASLSRSLCGAPAAFSRGLCRSPPTSRRGTRPPSAR